MTVRGRWSGKRSEPLNKWTDAVIFSRQGQSPQDGNRVMNHNSYTFFSLKDHPTAIDGNQARRSSVTEKLVSTLGEGFVFGD